MSVKYQVERRPVGPTGKVYRGSAPGDYISVLSNPGHKELGGALMEVRTVRPLAKGHSAYTKYVPAGFAVPQLLSNPSGEEFSHVMELSGEPWLVHSTHFSIDSAIESAAPLAGSIGSENVRLVKVLSHTTMFKLN